MQAEKFQGLEKYWPQKTQGTTKISASLLSGNTESAFGILQIQALENRVGSLRFQVETVEEASCLFGETDGVNSSAGCQTT